MFMASVAVGKAYVTKKGSLDKEFCPPQGYDSVVGEVRKTLQELLVGRYPDKRNTDITYTVLRFFAGGAFSTLKRET